MTNEAINWLLDEVNSIVAVEAMQLGLPANSVVFMTTGIEDYWYWRHEQWSITPM